MNQVARKEPLAVASLVCGILGICCFGFLTGLPAIICGHIARSRIRKNPGVEGAGMAMVGLVLGYISTILTLVLVPLLFAISMPAVAAAKERAELVMHLNAARQLHLALGMAALDGAVTQGTTGWPADIQARTAADVVAMLTKEGYLDAAQIETLGFEALEIGNVAESDPPDTILIRTKPERAGKGAVVMLKDGSGHVLRPGQPIPGRPPPREPPFLN